MNNKTILEEHQRLVLNRQDIYSLIAEEYTKLYFKENKSKILYLIEQEEDTNRDGSLSIYLGRGKNVDIPKDNTAFSKAYSAIRSAFRNIVRGVEKHVPVLSATGRKKLSNDYKIFANDNKEVMDKISKQVLTQNLFKNIAKNAPEFPNTDKGKSNTDGFAEFVYALKELATAYDSIFKAATTGEMPAVLANELIADLRNYIKFNLDNELSDYYKHALRENKTNKNSLLERAFGGQGFSAGVKDNDNSQNTDVDYAAESETIKDLKSTKAPKILAALGALGLGFEWLVKQPWFLQLFKNPTTAKQLIQTLTKGHTQGVTQHLATLTGQSNLSGMKVSDFISLMKSKGLVDSAGNPVSNLIKLASDAGNNNFAKWWATNLAGPTHANQTLAQAIPLSGAGAPGAGGDIFTKQVTSKVGETIMQGGGLSAVGATVSSLGPLAGVLGIGLIASGAAIAVLRKASLQKSRAAIMASVLNIMQNVPVTSQSIVDIAQSEGPKTSTGVKGREPEQPTVKQKEVQFYVKKSGLNSDKDIKQKSLVDLLKAELGNSKNQELMKIWKSNPEWSKNTRIKIATLADSIVGNVIQSKLAQQGATVQEAVQSQTRLKFLEDSDIFKPYLEKLDLNFGEFKETQLTKNDKSKISELIPDRVKAERYKNIIYVAKNKSGEIRAFSIKKQAKDWADTGKPQDDGGTTTTQTTTTTQAGTKTEEVPTQTGSRVIDRGGKEPTKTNREKQTYTVVYSRAKPEIEKFLKKQGFSDDDIEIIEDKVLEIVEKWLEIQRKDQKNPQQYLGLAESQINRWKQLSGIIKG